MNTVAIVVIVQPLYRIARNSLKIKFPTLVIIGNPRNPHARVTTFSSPKSESCLRIIGDTPYDNGRDCCRCANFWSLVLESKRG